MGTTKNNPAIRVLSGKPKKSLSTVRDREFKAFPLANIRERKFGSSLVRLTTHKLIVSVDAVIGVELLATTLAGKHMATVPPHFVLARHLQRLESFVTYTTRGNHLSLMCFVPPTLIPSSNNMISLTNLPSTPAGPGASRWAPFFMCSLKLIIVLKVM